MLTASSNNNIPSHDTPLTTGEEEQSIGMWDVCCKLAQELKEVNYASSASVPNPQEGVGDIISGSIVLKSTEISDDELIRIEEGLNLPSATGRTELLHVKKSSVVGTS